MKRSSHHLSWEVDEAETVAPDEVATGVVGLMWSRKSYTCSFCKRVFRSAQALGGHMNVHRRDRANLLKQIASHDTIHRHHHLRSLSKSMVGVSVPLVSPTRVSSSFYSQIGSVSEFVQAKHPMGLEFSTMQYNRNEEDAKESKLSPKRRKKTTHDGDGNVALFPSFEKAKDSNGTRPMEALDLELRLGLVTHLIN